MRRTPRSRFTGAPAATPSIAEKYGASIGDVAKNKIMAPVGDHDWHPRERVLRSEGVTVVNSGIPEKMVVVHTEAPEGRHGAPRTGRVLLAFEPADVESGLHVGGLYWVEEKGRRKLQSVYLDQGSRGGHAMALLVERARAVGVSAAVGPFSEAGRRMVARYGFEVEEEN